MSTITFRSLDVLTNECYLRMAGDPDTGDAQPHHDPLILRLIDKLGRVEAEAVLGPQSRQRSKYIFL